MLRMSSDRVKFLGGFGGCGKPAGNSIRRIVFAVLSSFDSPLYHDLLCYQQSNYRGIPAY
jgi:hypothetical protein